MFLFWKSYYTKILNNESEPMVLEQCVKINITIGHNVE